MTLNVGEQIEIFLANTGFQNPLIEDLTMLSEYRVVFAGMVKNGERTLPLLLPQLEILGCAFKESYFFILESNSVDNTRDIIKNWGKTPINCQHIHDHYVLTKSASKLHNHNDYNENSFSGSDIDANYDEFDDNGYDKNEQDEIDHDNYLNSNNHEYDDNKFFATISNEEEKKSIFKPGKMKIFNFQPSEEFEEVKKMLERKKNNYAREDRYIIYRNYILNEIKKFYSTYHTKTQNKIDYLIWIDLDLHGIHLQNIAYEFSYAWRNHYDVVCADGVKYSGWYFDSYATIYNDGVWAYGHERWRITNRIRSQRYYDVRSCFGGFAAYNFSLLVQSQCQYEHFGYAFAKLKSFESFVNIYHIDLVCEHIAFNYCLREHKNKENQSNKSDTGNNMKMAIASNAYVFYGTSDAHGVVY